MQTSIKTKFIFFNNQSVNTVICKIIQTKPIVLTTLSKFMNLVHTNILKRLIPSIQRYKLFPIHLI